MTAKFDDRSIVSLVDVAHDGLYGAMRETALLQKSHLLGAFGGVHRGMTEFFAPDFARADAFISVQIGFNIGQRVIVDTMTLQFSQDTVIAKAPGAAMHQRF
jgi:hypothetical protein